MRLPTIERGLSTIERAVDPLDKWLFLIVFGLGAVLITTLKVLGLPQWSVTAAPVFLMLLYFSYIWFTPRFLLRDDHASDNLYYLGFLFTLVSLSIALFQFSHSAGRAGPELISNFGIALATTIVGLALRVTLLQMRQNPAQIERLARTELAKAATELRKQLEASILEVELFRSKLVQRATDVVDFAATKTTDSLTTLLSQFADAEQQIISVVQQSFEPIVDHGRRLRIASERLVKGLEDASARIDALEVPTELVARRLDTMLASLNGAVGSYVERLAVTSARHDACASSIEGLRKRLDATSTTVDTLGASLSAVAASTQGVLAPLEKLGELSTHAEQATDRLTSLDAALAQYGDTVQGASEQATRSARTLAATTNELEKHTTGTIGVLDSFEKTLRFNSESLSRCSAEFAKLDLPTARMARRISELAESLAPLMRNARESIEAFRLLSTASEHIRELNDQLERSAKVSSTAAAQAAEDTLPLDKNRRVLRDGLGASVESMTTTNDDPATIRG
jgi:predicted RNase H-like nuclease (RuvC/YqgF family)